MNDESRQKDLKTLYLRVFNITLNVESIHCEVLLLELMLGVGSRSKQREGRGYRKPIVIK